MPPSGTLAGANVRVSTADFFPADEFEPAKGPADVFQQNEPHIAVHPANANLIAVGMNDVRTFGQSGDAWQSLAVSTSGGASWQELLIPGYPGDASAQGLASPVRGNRAASDPWLSFDNFNHLFFSFIAFQRTPPGRPDFDPQDTNVIAVAKYNVVGASVSYVKTVVVERGTVGLGRQEDKEAMTVDNWAGSPFGGTIYVCWARFTGAQDHLKVARSTDAGESYQLSEVTAASNMQGCNLTVAPNGDVYVSWRTFDPNAQVSNKKDSAVWVARSTDGGATFGAPVRVASFVDYRQNARRDPPIFRTFNLTYLAADGNGIYAAWQQRDPLSGSDVVVSRSKTHGATWEAAVRPYATSTGHQLMPYIATAAGRLSVVWYDSRSEPSFQAGGPVSGQCPAAAKTGAGCTGMDVVYAQADTSDAGPLAFSSELRVTSQSFNPNLYGSIRAITPFIGDYIAVAVNATHAFVVWGDNRDINPSKNALEDADPATNLPALINKRSRDSNIYFQKIEK